jgi:hypothetical protein
MDEVIQEFINKSTGLCDSQDNDETEQQPKQLAYVGFLGGSIQSHKNKDSLYRRKSLESGRIEEIVYKYRASPAVRSIDFIILVHHSQRSTLQVDSIYYTGCS